MRPNTEDSHCKWGARTGQTVTYYLCGILVLVILGFKNPTVAWGQANNALPTSECEQYKQFVQVKTDDLTRRATHKVEPDTSLLKQAGVHARITVKVFVSENGSVICARSVGNPNPYLGKLSLEAAKSWTFKPLVRNGRSVGMQGDLIFQIDR
jgi:hypothetical protein